MTGTPHITSPLSIFVAGLVGASALACSGLEPIGDAMDALNVVSGDAPAAESNDAPEAQPAASDTDQEATCCVNGAFYDCPDVVEAKVCVGEPFQMMQCLQSCSGSSCEDSCIQEHGPEPDRSECTRAPARDSEC